jgi:pyruvate dehydrogenase E2 component (dihydrolipoamide acetyltransferase)
MPIELKMPALSPTMEEGTLARWLVKEGDTVSSGDLLAEIETDKATMEFEAVDEGTITQILVPEGTDGVKVGAVIAMIAGEDEDASAAPKPAAAAPAAASPPRRKKVMASARRPIRHRQRSSSNRNQHQQRPATASRPRPSPGASRRTKASISPG